MPSTNRQQELASWLNYNDSAATTLVAIAIDSFGTEWLEWEPETLRLECRDRFGVQLSQLAMDKLMAMTTVLTTNKFYIDVHAFNHICHALNDVRPDFHNFDLAEPDEMAWGVNEVLLVDPPEKNWHDRFSAAVRKFIGIALAEARILNPPEILAMADIPQTPDSTAEDSYADDPIIYAGFHKASQRKTVDIKSYVQSRQQVLIGQLQSLPLLNRDQNSWRKFLEKARQR